ncbi:MAG: energy-coupling factor transporter transmembrane protein EcfT [Microbacterium sp.]
MIALYLPGDSPLHRLPAAVKLIGIVVLALAFSFAVRDLVSALLVLALVVCAYALAGFVPMVLLRQLWLARWIVVFMAVSQLVFLTPLDAVVSTVRVVAVVLLAALLTLTTRSQDLLEVIERATRPFEPFGADPRRLGLTLSLTIAMVPVVAEFARRVRDAQQARGVRLGPRFIVPLLVMALRHADDVGDALTARGAD